MPEEIPEIKGKPFSRKAFSASVEGAAAVSEIYSAPLDQSIAHSYISCVWTIEYSDEAIKVLKRLPSNLARRIRDKIRQIAADPYAPNNNLRPLSGRSGYRLRVGDWRVIYQLHNAVLIVFVITIAPRGGAYED